MRADIPAAEPRRRATIETDGRAARRMLAFASALEGASREDAARQAGMDRQSRRGGVHRFNSEGIEGLRDRPHSGRPSRLTEGQMASFRAAVLRGPDSEKDGLSSWTAKDLCRIVEKRYKVSYSENGMLKLLKSLDLAWQKTRPAHPKADIRAQACFKKNSAAGSPRPRRPIPKPGASRPGCRTRPGSARPAGTADPSAVSWPRPFQGSDERPPDLSWFQKGTRASGIKDQRHTAVYLFGAVCPERDAAFGLVLPVVGADVMQTFLDQLSGEISPGVHALLIMDRAGWHCAGDLVMPENITAVCLPPCSPELNAIERLWLYLKERFLSHRLWPDDDAIVDAVCQAWQRVTNDAGRIKSLCSMEWAETVKN
jgi:transposase